MSEVRPSNQNGRPRPHSGAAGIDRGSVRSRHTVERVTVPFGSGRSVPDDTRNAALQDHPRAKRPAARPGQARRPDGAARPQRPSVSGRRVSGDPANRRAAAAVPSRKRVSAGGAQRAGQQKRVLHVCVGLAAAMVVWGGERSSMRCSRKKNPSL